MNLYEIVEKIQLIGAALLLLIEIVMILIMGVLINTFVFVLYTGKNQKSVIQNIMKQYD